MDIQKIQDQLDKVNADIEKREQRIKTLEEREQKKKTVFEKAVGFEIDYDKYVFNHRAKANSVGHKYYDEFADIDFGVSNDVERDYFDEYYNLLTTIRDQLSCWNKIFDLEDRRTKLETQLQMEISKQNSIDELPPIMKELKQGVYEMLLNRYFQYRENAIDVEKQLFGLPKSEAKKVMKSLIYKYGAVAMDYEYWCNCSDEEIEKRAKKDSDFYVLDLIRRVTKKV